MNLGNNIIIILILYFSSLSFTVSEEKITSSPLLNIDELKPSFEELEDVKENFSSGQNLKEKKKLHLNHRKQF